MKKYDLNILALSWEERCPLGFKEDSATNAMDELIIVCNKNSVNKDKKSLDSIEEICKKKKIKIDKLAVPYNDSVGSWNAINGQLEHKLKGKKVLLNISTMPRDITWTLLYLLRRVKAKISYVYHKPGGYTEEWLSKEPGNPRLLFKHSGVVKPGWPTALLILTGFDYERTQQLVNFYEPRIVVLGIQGGNQFKNKERNQKEKHIEACKGQAKISLFEFDAYSEDNGYGKINAELKKLKKYNIIVSSLGPKMSSIALYKIFLNNPTVALAYVPSKNYNPKYSFGIGAKVSGELSD